MSDAQSHGAKATSQRAAIADYVANLLDCAEDPKSKLSREAARLSAQALDDIIGVAPQDRIELKLPILLKKLISGNKVVWARLLLTVNGQIPEFYDRALSLSPYKGKLLLLVSDWGNRETVQVDGELARRLGWEVRPLRKHKDRHREQFIVAINPPVIALADITRLPRPGEE